MGLLINKPALSYVLYEDIEHGITYYLEDLDSLVTFFEIEGKVYVLVFNDVTNTFTLETLEGFIELANDNTHMPYNSLPYYLVEDISLRGSLVVED